LRSIPISPEKIIERFVYAYVIEGERLFLIDSGVAEAENDISIAQQTFTDVLALRNISK